MTKKMCFMFYFLLGDFSGCFFFFFFFFFFFGCQVCSKKLNTLQKYYSLEYLCIYCKSKNMLVCAYCFKILYVQCIIIFLLFVFFFLFISCMYLSVRITPCNMTLKIILTHLYVKMVGLTIFSYLFF